MPETPCAKQDISGMSVCITTGPGSMTPPRAETEGLHTGLQPAASETDIEDGFALPEPLAAGDGHNVATSLAGRKPAQHRRLGNPDAAVAARDDGRYIVKILITTVINVHFYTGLFSGIEPAVAIGIVETQAVHCQHRGRGGIFSGTSAPFTRAAVDLTALLSVVIFALVAGRGNHGGGHTTGQHTDDRTLIMTAVAAHQPADSRTEGTAERTACGHCRELVIGAAAQHPGRHRQEK